LASTAEMENFIDHQMFDRMKKSAYILNCAARSLFDFQYVVDKVEKEELAGFFFEGEEKITAYQGNVFPTTELAYFTQNTLDNESQRITESILGIANEKPINVVKL